MEEQKLPLMRDGDQWRPMIHVEDTSDAIIFMLSQEKVILIKKFSIQAHLKTVIN